ncbi:unnamed protein product [Cryptosporidium hominis]|uniref:Uncharacterized protein n=1 Tax=Cryptosporidium hominis TaxID=237895 RepID=A0A0S4TAZ2_CRYHO|nr:hypothetical protein [Cryptosporidium hominis TU502]OLQ17113.1 hypothetical protein ChTU502y2012_398g0035 [Cryptosporidium hominis]PPA65122.1 hypothetical protein ChUKH1_15555 [Cryptosporidium hominis]PPS93575.1 Uncharacterized protein GY17_00003648 [Cryptosporidium hominis]CUV04363.1 unnamed protein product [Cryptosporidium hominis]|eukprot:PPS93575.1 Uncharacterized protein GY17_00003648 [Cryptosporidium hominis]
MGFITNYFHAIFLILIINSAFFTINEVHPSEYKFSILQVKAPRCSKLRSLLCCCSASSRNEEDELPNQNEGDGSGIPVLLAYNPISNTDESNSGDTNSNDEEDPKCCSSSSSSSSSKRKKADISKGHPGHPGLYTVLLDFEPEVGTYSGFTNTKTTHPPSKPDPPQFIPNVRATTTTTTEKTKTTSNDS